jgi:hypothetical protein
VEPTVKHWPLAFAAAGLWFASFAGVGLALAVASGEHGSVIFLLWGAMSGAGGAVMCVALLLWPLFRRLSFGQRTLFLALAADLAFALSCSYFSMGITDIATIAAYLAVPMLAASALVNRVLERRQREA